MGRNKNKKANEQKAAEADGRTATGETTRSKTETTSTSQPVSYAAAAAEPPIEENKVTYVSATVPAITVNEPASDVVSASHELAPTSSPSGIFEDDAVDVAFLSTPESKRTHTVDGSDSDFSLLKKDEISDAGSPGQLVDNEKGNTDGSKEKPSIEGKEPEEKASKSDDPPPKTKTTEDETGTETKASLHSSMKRVLAFQKTSNALVGSISKADWDKTFDSESKERKGMDAAEASTPDGATGTKPIHPIVTENRRLAQAFDEQEADSYANRVLLQEATDELDATERERARLEEDRDRCKKELDETRETLQSVHERRQKLQDEKDKHRMREADWEKEKERFEAQIEQLSRARSAGGGDGGPSASPPKVDTSSRSPNNASENAALKDEIQQLQKQLKDSQDELNKAQDELKIFRSYRKKQEDEHIYKAKIAACATENEKLHKFGRTLDLESHLYRILKKLADYHDSGGPEPTSKEYTQMKEFKDCIDERRRIMFLARTHSDPKALIGPYLEKWRDLEEKSDWGMTLFERMMATSLALSK